MTEMNEFEKSVLAQSLLTPTGIKTPTHCGLPMLDDGGCSQGCCDDFKCRTCGETLRVEWPD